MRQLSDIISDGNAATEALLKEAFEAGKAAAAAEMRAKMAAVIDMVEGKGTFTKPGPRGLDVGSIGVGAIVGSPLISAPSSALLEGRATPGTVKPAIVSLIKQAGGNGITTDELIEITNFKPNSVRGTVSTLHTEKTIRRIGDRWIAAENYEGSEAEAPEPS